MNQKQIDKVNKKLKDRKSIIYNKVSVRIVELRARRSSEKNRKT